MTGAGARIAALARKEGLQILRDPSSIAIAFVLPMLLLILFGYGVSLDAREVPVAIVVEQPGPEVSRFVAGFEHSPWLRPVQVASIQEGETLMRHHRVDAIVWLREPFTREVLAGGGAPVGVIVDGVNANQARIVEGYVQGVWLRWTQALARAGGREPTSPVALEYRIRFNPAVRSRNFLVPGLIAVIMTLTGALLTAMVFAREWERGTMEGLLSTPARVPELLLGKLVPYFVLGMGGMAVTFVLAVTVLEVPYRGSLWVLLLASTLFMLTALGMGMLISIVGRTQFVAGQIAIVATFLPAFILSGFIFDIRSMPEPIQAVTWLIPARYFVSALQSLFLAGDVWPVLLPNLAVLGGLALAFQLLVRLRTRKRLQ